jgi:hypothetical protein
MRSMILTVCVLAAACSGQVPNSPTSPTSAPRPAAQTPSQGGADLPMHGSFTLATSGEVNCPPACPPTTLRVSGTGEGTATHLGRFTAAFVDNVNLATATSTGTFSFTAANGDRLFTTTSGGEDQFTPPNISHVRLQAEIVGGTGRFAGATGTLIIRTIGTIDFASGTSTGTGSFEGRITPQR